MGEELENQTKAKNKKINAKNRKNVTKKKTKFNKKKFTNKCDKSEKDYLKKIGEQYV